MNPEDSLASLHVGEVDHHLTVEAPRAQECRIEDVGTVGRGKEDDPLVGLEPVHLDQQRVQGLLPLVVATAQPGATVPSHGVDLVDEDDAGRVRLPLLEEVADPGRTHSHEHFHEIGA